MRWSERAAKAAAAVAAVAAVGVCAHPAPARPWPQTSATETSAGVPCPAIPLLHPHAYPAIPPRHQRTWSRSRSPGRTRRQALQRALVVRSHVNRCAAPHLVHHPRPSQTHAGQMLPASRPFRDRCGHHAARAPRECWGVLLYEAQPAALVKLQLQAQCARGRGARAIVGKHGSQ